MTIFLAVVAVFSLIAAVLGVRYGLLGVRYGKAQAQIAQAMKDRHDEQEREVTDWFVKHETLALQLSKVGADLQIRRPDGTVMHIYPTIFSDVTFREKLERYVVRRNGGVLTSRSPTELELRSPSLRETVTKANEILDAFDKKYPGIVGYYMSRD